MRPRFIPACLSVLLPPCLAVAQVITPANWYNDRAGAVSLTFDDALSGHWSHASPIMTAAGVRGTFFVITGAVDWDGARAAARDGHEIGSHSTLDATLKDDPDAAAKMRQSHDAIEAQIGVAVPGYRCDTIAWPYGFRRLDVVNDPAHHGLYLAARNAGNALLAANSYNKPDLSQWWKFGEGDYGEDHFFVVGDALMTSGTALATFEAQLDLVEAQRAWTVFTYHGIETGGYQNISAAAFTGQVAAAAARADSTLWVAPFGEVIRYIRQRAAVQASVVENSGQQIRVEVGDDLDDAVFNLPLTLMLDLPAGWTGVQASQSGAPIEAWVAGDRLVFNAVPDAGEVLLQSAGGAGPGAPVVSIAAHGAGLGVAFVSESGYTYTLEAAASPAGPWGDAPGVGPLAGDGAAQAFVIDPMPALPVFYRVRVAE
jgi:peptidoglycan/xylan/chitin deacetylase (PgdA/CDA1 family)